MITPSTNVHHLFYKWNNTTVSVLFKIIYLVFKKSVLFHIKLKLISYFHLLQLQYQFHTKSQSSTKWSVFMKEQLFVPSIAIIYHILRELRIFCFCCKQFTKRGKISSHTLSHTLEH